MYSQTIVQVALTLRDEIALRVLPAVYAEFHLELRNDESDGFHLNEIANEAYRMADAMLKAREEGR